MGKAYQVVDLGLCPLCGRQMIAGASVDEHHFVPKSKGGRDKVPLHKICHRKIHSLFNEKELSLVYNTPEKLLEHPDIQAFVKWVQKKQPEYNDNSKRSKSKAR